MVAPQPLAVQFPAHLLDTGLGKDDVADFILHLAEGILQRDESGIVGILDIHLGVHGAEEAEKAVAGWHAAVRGEGDVSNLPLQDVTVPAEGLRIAALLTAAGITPSNSEANRKLKERSVRVDGEVFEDAARLFTPGFEGVIAVGKRNFARVRLVEG